MNQKLTPLPTYDEEKQARVVISRGHFGLVPAESHGSLLLAKRSCTYLLAETLCAELKKKSIFRPLLV